MHLGSFFSDEEALLARLKAEEAFLVDQYRKLPLWIDFYETQLTDPILVEVIHFMDRLHNQIPRLALVGCSGRDRRRFERLMKKQGRELWMPIQFFSDPEVAKTWLVSESGLSKESHFNNLLGKTRIDTNR